MHSIASPGDSSRRSPLLWMRSQKHLRHRESGVTVLEFTLVGFAFFVILLALFDFVRFLVVQSILRSAANRALSQASVVQNLDSDCPSLPLALQATCPQNRTAAIQQVLNTLEDLPVNTMVSRDPTQGAHYLIAGTDEAPAAEIILSADDNYRAYFINGLSGTPMTRTPALMALDSLTPTGQPTLRSVLQRDPIQVTLRARFRPVLGLLGEIPVEGSAAGFREIRGVSSFPPRLDCRGFEVPIGQTPDDTNCPCAANPDNPLVVQGNGTCVCVNGEMTPVTNPANEVVSCACPANQVVSGTDCVCPPKNCPTGTVLDSATCDCKCPNNQVEGSSGCTCPAPLQVSGDHCSCPPNPTCTNSGGWLDGTTCQCTCPGNKPMDTNTNQCTCPVVPCEGGTVNFYCKCKCPNGFSLKNGMCICPPPKVIIGGFCKCPDVACGGGGWLNSSCLCQCPSNKVLVGSVCQCPPATQCQGGQYDSNCKCQCPNGQVQSGSQCACPGGQISTGSGCACPSNKIWNGSSCVCPANQQFINNVCQCPVGTVPLGDGSCFKDE